MKTKTAVLSSVFCAGFLLGIAPLAQADTLITFQCDMTYQVQSGTFTNGVSQVYAYAFDPYNSSHPLIFSVPLTNNPAASNPNLYMGTYDDTVQTNGSQFQWLFYAPGFPNSGYEQTANASAGNNRVTLLPAGSGQQTLVLPVAWFDDAGPSAGVYVGGNVTFQVDMSQAIHQGLFNPGAGDYVQPIGALNMWQPDQDLMTNDPSILVTNAFGLVTSNVYVGTFVNTGQTASPGEISEFKYYIGNSTTAKAIYETPSALNGFAQNYFNRFCFVLANDQTLPIVSFSDQPYAPVGTNTFTFSVDMSVFAWNGMLTNQGVYLQGDFNGWSNQQLTNNPNAGNTNIYYLTEPITNAYDAALNFKFYIPGFPNGGYEYNPFHTYPGNPSVLGNTTTGNRQFLMPAVTGSNFDLPTVYFSDISTNTVLPAPPAIHDVTFTVNMTNAVGTDGHVFNASTDSVYLNGLVLTNPPGSYAFATWTNAPSGPTWTNAIANFLMQNNPPGSELYTITVPIPAGYPLEVSYQYSIGGITDEATNYQNHVRYIRGTGNYTMPMDKFGDMVHEQLLANLAVGPKSAGSVPITWLGTPGVHLQVSTNLATGVWTTLSGTDAQSTTNYPVGAGASYFRLINPF